jgi:hypothetical protein
MRGRLHLSNASPPVELSARVVKHGRGDDALYSWHGDLQRYDHETGILTLDDGRDVTIVVVGGFLRPVVPGKPARDA